MREKKANKRAFKINCFRRKLATNSNQRFRKLKVQKKDDEDGYNESEQLFLCNCFLESKTKQTILFDFERKEVLKVEKAFPVQSYFLLFHRLT